MIYKNKIIGLTKDNANKRREWIIGNVEYNLHVKINNDNFDVCGTIYLNLINKNNIFLDFYKPE